MSTRSVSGDGQAFSKLSQQEKQVLLRLSQGRPEQEIARTLFLGEGTIRNTVNSLLSKLGVIDQAEAIAYALKHDLRGHMDGAIAVY
jgi:DNA-binding NarL/FixJ family response regulator